MDWKCIPRLKPGVGDASEETRCVIADAGPGGAMLALLLARRGVPVTLVEMHKDFDREFRGDTVHPSTLEILDQLGLAEKVHQDAVVSANLLAKPLLDGRVDEQHLSEVQRQGEQPTKFMQGFQAMMQKRVLAPALASTQTSIEVPWFVRFLVKLPILKDVPPRLIGFGLRRVRIDENSLSR